HVLGYGVRTLVRDRHVDDIVAGVRAAGGFAALAHPMYKEALGHLDRRTLDALDGFEVWNGKADGGAYPSDAAIRRLAELRRTGSAVVPMAGADLHRLDAYPGITLHVTCSARPAPSGDGHGPSRADDILAALRRRAYRVTGRAWHFAATDPLREPPRSPRRLAAAAALDVRRRAKRMSAWLKRHGLPTP